LGFENLAKIFKKKLDMDAILIIGNPNIMNKSIGVLVGGGSLGLGDETNPMKLIIELELDTVICGDKTEWTLSAYVRNAVKQELTKSKAMKEARNCV